MYFLYFTSYCTTDLCLLASSQLSLISITSLYKQLLAMVFSITLCFLFFCLLFQGENDLAVELPGSTLACAISEEHCQLPGASDRLLTSCGSHSKDGSHLSRIGCCYAIRSTAISNNASCKRNYYLRVKHFFIDSLKGILGQASAHLSLNPMVWILANIVDYE